MKKIVLCMLICAHSIGIATPINIVVIARGERVLMPADYNESAHTITTQFEYINRLLADRLQRAYASKETNIIRKNTSETQLEFFEHLALTIDPNFLRQSIALASEPLSDIEHLDLPTVIQLINIGTTLQVNQIIMKRLFSRCVALAINQPHRCAFDVDQRPTDQLPAPVDDNVTIRNANIAEQMQYMICDNFIKKIIIPHSPYTPLRFDGCTSVDLLAWSPNGQMVATKACHEACIRIWNVNTRNQVGQILPEHDHTGNNNLIKAFTWSPNSKFIATGSKNGTVQIWHVENMANIHLEGSPIVMPEQPHGERPSINAIAWSPNGRFLAFGLTDETVRIWDITTNRQVGNPLEGQRLTIRSVAWSPNPASPLIAVSTNGGDGCLCIWHALEGRLVRSLNAHLDRDSAFAWSPNGKAIATISDGTDIVIWDANNGTIIKEPLEHRCKLASLSWSPDSAFIAAGSVNEETYIWEVDSGKRIRQLKCGLCSIVAWSPLHDCFVTGSTTDLQFWLPLWHAIIEQKSDLLKRLLMLKVAQRPFIGETELRTLKPLCDQLPQTAREWAHEQIAQAWATRAKSLLNTSS